MVLMADSVSTINHPSLAVASMEIHTVFQALATGVSLWLLTMCLLTPYHGTVEAVDLRKYPFPVTECTGPASGCFDYPPFICCPFRYNQRTFLGVGPLRDTEHARFYTVLDLPPREPFCGRQMEPAVTGTGLLCEGGGNELIYGAAWFDVSVNSRPLVGNPLYFPGVGNIRPGSGIISGGGGREVQEESEAAAGGGGCNATGSPNAVFYSTNYSHGEWIIEAHVGKHEVLLSELGKIKEEHEKVKWLKGQGAHYVVHPE